ncbi:MAG: KH domain-containing protein [Phycisphaerae bacterium]
MGREVQLEDTGASIKKIYGLTAASDIEYRIVGTPDQVEHAVATLRELYPPAGYFTRVFPPVTLDDGEVLVRYVRSASCD